MSLSLRTECGNPICHCEIATALQPRNKRSNPERCEQSEAISLIPQRIHRIGKGGSNCLKT